MDNYYPIKICGLKRLLPLKSVSRHTQIACLNILGDIELVDKAAAALAHRLKPFEFDYFVGPEVKVLPLIHELSKKMKRRHYVICRKSIKFYMTSPTILKPLPYFPKHVKQLVIDGADSQLLQNKKVIIVDDVVSTGVTMRMIKKLMEKVNAKIVAYVAIIRQGEEQFDKLENFIYLTKLPILKDYTGNNFKA
jgi:adenine phosphoribosyltransferase